jgi:hypothetical protein
LSVKAPGLLKRLKKILAEQSPDSRPDLLLLVALTFWETPNLLLVAGKCEAQSNGMKVFPNPDDDSVSFKFNTTDVIEGPLEFKSSLDFFNRDDIRAIRVSRNCVMTLINNGESKQVALSQSPERPLNLCAFEHSKYVYTWCKGLLEFECGTNNFLGPCLGFWSCH